MKLTVPGKDVICINEGNIDNYKQEAAAGVKFHVIKFGFNDPTKEKIEEVTNYFPNTNRYIISDNVRFYNGHLKHVGKKYYVQNTAHNSGALLSFFRKNNKILVDFTCMNRAEAIFLLENYFEDILANTEIIIIDENDMSTYASVLKNWPGNVIIRSPDYPI
jgi:hypothetical protein